MPSPTRQSSIDDFLAQRTLAVAGVSLSGKGFGNVVLKDLSAKGYTMLPVHPQAAEVGGVRAYHSLADLPDAVGGVVLVVPPAQTELLVREAKETGIERVWMQQGAESDDAIRFCENNGIEAIHGECIMMFAQPSGVHRLHHWLRGIFGRLPPADD